MNSIEEDIKRIAKLITTKFNNDYSIDNVDKEAIEELLKAYKELKEIEESHRKENGELRERVKELEENEIEVGEYVRIKEKGIIGKIEQIGVSLFWLEDGSAFRIKEESYKHSKNIINLVEVGDYVNGYKVISVDYNVIDDKTECIELDLNNNYQYNFISARQIKTIITKEQFASIEYKVEE